MFHTVVKVWGPSYKLVLLTTILYFKEFVLTTDEKITRLEAFKQLLLDWHKNRQASIRSQINQERVWVRREVIEAGCFHTLTISPPPAVGGLIMRDVDPFDMIFDAPYLMNMTPKVTDMIDQTIGAIQNGSDDSVSSDYGLVEWDADVQKGYAFIAMPIDPADHFNEDVLDAIKDAAKRCGIHAERVDEPQSNERITDRILESIRKAEYVIADLTGSRPNVFYEAGYAQGLRKTPIYIARKGTRLEFDLKDYPIIFFEGMKELKDSLEKRLRGLTESRNV